MKIGNFLGFLFLIFETSFYLVLGQTINKAKSDCTLLNNYLNGDSKDYANDCCSDVYNGIKCDDEGYITYISNMGSVKITDLNSFPYLSRIENLLIYNIDLKEIPNSILSLTSLKSLHLGISKIEVIPSEIQNLTKLEQLYLNNNEIRELPSEMFNLTNLKELNLDYNKIRVIPPSIQNLSKLERLVIGHNALLELPYKIFNLTNLKYLDLVNNQYLDTNIINFGNSTIKDCYFNEINILCYQPNTCEKIYFNNKYYSDEEAQKEFKICTKEVIDEMLSQKDKEEDLNQEDKKSSFPLIGIILGGIAIILIGVLVSFMLIKKRKSKRNNIDGLNSNGEFRNGSIRIVLNISNSNDANAVKKNNNDYSKNSDNNINSNVTAKDNINQTGLNNKQSNKHSSLDIRKSPLYYDKINMNRNTNDNPDIYFASIAENDESPPEYTEINESNEKQQYK